MRRRLWVPLLVLCTLALGGIRIEASATDSALVFANGDDLTGLNPLLPGNNADLREATMAFLVSTANGSPEPLLAAEIPTSHNGGISADRRTLVFHLRPGLRWSDGARLRSDDVAFTVGVINDPKTNIANREGFRFVSGVDTPDPQTIIFHLSQPLARPIAELFSDESMPILPKHLLQGVDVNTSDYMSLPVGAGPFRYSKWLRGERVELERNPYFYGPAAKTDKIVYLIIPNLQSTAIAIRTGQINFWPRASKGSVDELSDVASLEATVLPAVRPQFLLLNVRTPPLNDVAVRAALRAAVDRVAIVKKIYAGGAELDDEIVSQNDPHYLRLPQEPFNLKKAESILDADGWRMGADGVRVKGGKRLVVPLVGVAGNVYVDEMFELIRANWKAAGVEVETRTATAGVLFSEDPAQGILRGGKFAAALYSLFQVRVSDLESYLSCKNISPAGSNVSGLCDPALDTLFERFDAATDNVTESRLAGAIQERINTVVPLIVVAKRNEYYIMRDSVAGFRPSPFAPFAGIASVQVK